jgi:ABC-type multidrug transport system ATPase subunit
MALEIVSISHRFKKQEVLSQVSLRIERGDCYGLLGHNGAGKTTLLRAALGLIKPISGRVVVDDFSIQAFPREACARLGGLIEYPCFNETWDGLKNLRVWACLQGLNRAQAVAEAKRVLRLVALDSHNGITDHKKVRDYSQGMKQRLGIAQALMGHPSYVLLDEPFNGLDPQAIVDLRALIRCLTQDQDVAVVISSHQLAEISGLCNRVAILREGVLLVEDAMDSLLDTDKKLYRLRVATGPSPACGFLQALHIPHQLEERGQTDDHASSFLVDLNHMKPARLTGHLLDKEIDLLALTPCDPSLEEVYLRIDSRAAEGEQSLARKTERPPPTPVTKPQVHKAPQWAFLRGIHYESTRLLSGLKIVFLLILPAFFADISIYLMHREAMADAEKVGHEVFSMTQMTAFDGVGQGLKIGLPILMALVAGLASQSIAGEQSRGTLRYLFLRPINRLQIALSKFSSLVLLCMTGYGLLVISSLAVSAYLFDFTDLAEVLPNGNLFPLVQKTEMLNYLRPTLLAPLLPLVAYTALGFALGSWARNNVAALTSTLGIVLLLDLGRAFVPVGKYIGWLPSAHLPSPFGGESFLRYYCDMVQGVSNATCPYADLSVITPLAWLVLMMCLACVALKRKAG